MRLRGIFLTPPLGPEQGENRSTPQHQGLEDQKTLSISLRADPGLMIMKESLITQPWQDDCQGPPQKR
jgi:hypothetical protein